MQEPELHEILSVRAMNEDGAYLVTVDLTDMEGQRMTVDYPSRPNDPVGLNPLIREWLGVNSGEFEILPYVPPTAEHIRAGMEPVTRRQLRLALVRSGISLSSVETSISSMPAGQEKEEAQIEWADAATFNRLHPTLLLVSDALGLGAEQVDALWATALSI